MADLNGLKLINDSYGHQKGDQLLQKMAEIFKKSLRKEDILARQGGDEFAVLLPNTNRIEAAEILKRIRENMDKTKNDQMPVSTALGMTVKTNMDQKIDTIYKLADDAMYKDKNNN